MGEFYRSRHIRSYLLIFLAIFSLIIAGPVRSKLNSIADKKINGLTQFLHEKTGLSISYGALSPSVLSSLSLRDIDILDDNGNTLLSINRTKISYRLLKLLKGDFNSGISNIVVDGIVLDVDELVELISRFAENSEAVKIDFMEIKRNIPENISLKNITLSYDKDFVDASLAVKKVSVSNGGSRRVLGVQMSSSANVILRNINQNLSCKLDISGSIEENLDNSQLNIRISELTDGDIRLNKLSLYADYNDYVVGVHTIQAVNPIFIGADINLKTGDINAQLKSERMNPVSLVNINSRQKELRLLKDFQVTTDSILKFNYLQKTASFVSDTNAHIPEQIFDGGAELSFSLFGNENALEFTSFTVDGQKCLADASLSFVYETLQLSGFFDLPYYELPNGTSVSTEIYFDSLNEGFKAFSPQIFIGEKALTAFELTFLPQDDSYDFLVDVYDYAHSEDSMPGQLHLDGSYLLSSRYFQSNITLNSLYLDSLSEFIGSCLEKNIADSISSAKNTLSPYVLSGDVYFSTDLKSISYNVPYVLLANTRKDNQALMIAVNGTDQNVQLNQLSLVLGSYALEASASVDKSPDSDDLFFDVNFSAGAIPYHVSGTYMKGLCSISGDYGLDFQLRFPSKNDMSGHLVAENLPLAVLNRSFIFTTDMNFSYDEENGPALQVARFEAEEAGSAFSVSPRIVMSGNATKYGAQINSISYTDFYSALEGTADLMLNLNGNTLDSAGIMLDVKNPLSDEGVVLDCTVSNPDHLPLTLENLTKYIYINLQLQMNAFSLNRFVLQQHDNNMITGALFASGTIEHPYVALNVDNASIFVTSRLLNLNGNIILEDRDLSIAGLNVDYEWFKVQSIVGEASLEDLTLKADGDLKLVLLDKVLEAPVTLEAGNAIVAENSFVPDSFSARLVTNDIQGDLLKKRFPLEVSLLYANRSFSIFSSDNIGLSGSYSLDGILEMNLDNKSFARAKMDGFVNMQTANIELYDVDVDLKKMNEYLAFDDLFIFDKGVFSGTAIVTGSMSDPDINGFFMLDSPELRLPSVTQQKVSAQNIVMNIVNNEIEIPATRIKTKKGNQLEVGFGIFLNKWSIDHLEGTVKTLKKDSFPIKLVTPVARVSGDISCDLHLFYEIPNLEVTGRVAGENLAISSGLTSVTSLLGSSKAEAEVSPSLLITTDLEVVLGTHASVNFDPILRCVFVPNTTMNVKINQDSEEYIVEGNLQLKSGDIAYLNRNFYIKSGNVKFNPRDITNPQITINAETREKDDRGQNVKIVMDIDNQYLNDLNPRFSSTPAKSETEIRSLLGQIAVADSTSASNFLFAASDYALQSTIIRQTENTLRDWLNFDIFSVRTNILQNTLNMGVSGALTKENITIGNFLDNSTVYIGKYLGNSLYVDAMLHMNFEDNFTNNITPVGTSVGSLLFQPEFGMELESPFANIRLNMAPNINALINGQIALDPSLTLSWKFDLDFWRK